MADEKKIRAKARKSEKKGKEKRGIEIDRRLPFDFRDLDQVAMYLPRIHFMPLDEQKAREEI